MPGIKFSIRLVRIKKTLEHTEGRNVQLSKPDVRALIRYSERSERQAIELERVKDKLERKNEELEELENRVRLAKQFLKSIERVGTDEAHDDEAGE